LYQRHFVELNAVGTAKYGAGAAELRKVQETAGHCAGLPLRSPPRAPSLCVS